MASIVIYFDVDICPVCSIFFLFVLFFHKYLQCSAIHICQVNHLVLITADEKQLAIIIACFS